VTIADLHYIIQITMGRSDSHLDLWFPEIRMWLIHWELHMARPQATVAGSKIRPPHSG
jgi:hypothetical protein